MTSSKLKLPLRGPTINPITLEVRVSTDEHCGDKYSAQRNYECTRKAWNTITIKVN